MSEEKQSGQNHPVNYGAFSMILLIATGLGLKISIEGILANASSVLASVWSKIPGGTQAHVSTHTPPDIAYMYLLLLGSLAGYVLSLAFAGAGMATNRGSVFGALTIGVALLPVIYLAYAFFTAG